MNFLAHFGSLLVINLVRCNLISNVMLYLRQHHSHIHNSFTFPVQAKTYLSKNLSRHRLLRPKTYEYYFWEVSGSDPICRICFVHLLTVFRLSCSQPLVF